MPTVTPAKVLPEKNLSHYRYTITPEPADVSGLPDDVRSLVSGPALTAAAADTFHLAWFGFGQGLPDAQGWTAIDLTEQIGIFFHVAREGSDLDGGNTAENTVRTFAVTYMLYPAEEQRKSREDKDERNIFLFESIAHRVLS